MGYKREPRTYRITVEDAPGLEIVVRGLSMREYLDLAGAAPDADVRRAQAFAERLVSWNLTADVDGKEEEVPPTLDGLMSLEIDLGMSVVMAWLDAVVSAPAPLGAR